MSKQLILIFIFPELPIVKVHCSPEEMVVEMIKPFDTTHLYLEHLKNYPGEQNFCQMAVVYFWRQAIYNFNNVLLVFFKSNRFPIQRVFKSKFPNSISSYLSKVITNKIYLATIELIYLMNWISRFWTHGFGTYH